jgi:hypothetical protein
LKKAFSVVFISATDGRLQIILKLLTVRKAKFRNIVPVVRKVQLREANDQLNDLEYWLSKTPVERLSAVTDIIFQSMRPDQRMDKGKIVKRKLKL